MFLDQLVPTADMKMERRIADISTDSIGRLTGDEQELATESLDDMLRGNV